MARTPMWSEPKTWREEARTVLLAGAILLAAAFAAYANSFSVPLIFDDWATIQHNPAIRQLWPIWSPDSAQEFTGVGGRPVAKLSFVFNYAITGDSMRGFHAMNFALHILAGLLLFGVVRRTLARSGPRKGASVDADGIALAVAALWILHPVQTQSVTYVSQRTELLLGFFFLLTLYSFVRASAPGATWRWQAVTAVACLAGMGSKEGMATAPLMVFLYDYAWVTGSVRQAWRRRWRLYLALAASWGVLAVLLAGLRGRGVGFGLGMDAFSYLLIECGAVLRYLGLALWPWPLVFDYGTDLGGVGAAQIASAVVLVILAVGTVWALWRRPPWGFVGAWFFVTLAPTSSVVPIPLQPISENRVYVPLVAVMVALVFLLHRGLGRRGFPVMAGIAVGFAALTSARNGDYRSEISIWQDTVAKRPTSSRAHNNLGHALQAVGRLPEARVSFETALRLRPDYGEAHLNLAGVMGRLGLTDAALAHSRRAVELEPKNPNALYNLGVAFKEKGQPLEATAAFEAVLRLRPDFAEAHDNLAVIFMRAGQAAEAVRHSEAAVRAKPTSPDLRYTLASCLLLAGRFGDAVPLLQDEVRVRPDNLEARQNLGFALLQSGGIAEARQTFEDLLRVAPTHAAARLNLGGILLNSGHSAEAAGHLAAAVQAAPQSAEAHAYLGIALANTGQTAAAVMHLERALSLQPGLTFAQAALAGIRGREGQNAQRTAPP